MGIMDVSSHPDQPLARQLRRCDFSLGSMPPQSISPGLVSPSEFSSAFRPRSLTRSRVSNHSHWIPRNRARIARKTVPGRIAIGANVTGLVPWADAGVALLSEMSCCAVRFGWAVNALRLPQSAVQCRSVSCHVVCGPCAHRPDCMSRCLREDMESGLQTDSFNPGPSILTAGVANANNPRAESSRALRALEANPYSPPHLVDQGSYH
ncbi:hypothetical protein BP00DRAFT_153475 [Aspergillus indologenus CBS 114.80]|uniref:Uncharacterized protein n=1 Tax=Aspergillus indologenus CBS 114.80 TaxID=1450541 RepID=A0A2V5IBE4_9EURO|nr:hypothetical protein BP00DRAFT_153475 [Aspergillus indologenus CBS 114.80]